MDSQCTKECRVEDILNVSAPGAGMKAHDIQVKRWKLENAAHRRCLRLIINVVAEITVRLFGSMFRIVRGWGSVMVKN